MKEFTMYEQKQAREKLERDLDRNMTLLRAWEGVTRNYKKDGSAFANLKQNFNNLYVHDARYTLHSKEKELSVSARSELNGYVSDSFVNSECVKYAKFEVSPDRVIKESFLEPYFYYTADEIEQKIKERIAYYQERVNTIQKAIDGLNQDIEIMSNLLEHMTNELAKMNNDTASFFKEHIIRKFY